MSASNVARMVAFLWLALLAGCGVEVERYGSAARYKSFVKDPVKVVMPPDAPHIPQQFARHPDSRQELDHNGMDVWGRKGTPILAAAPGRVIRSFYEPAYGHQIFIDHGRDESGAQIVTIYRHLDRRGVSEGQTVARGEQIGTMGESGFMSALVHLHFEVRKERPGYSEPLDPQLFWVAGPGRVTCFEPGRSWPDRPFATTFPVQCRQEAKP